MSRWRVEVGDSRERLRELADASVDAVVTDPPYELGFMGKAWDASGIAYDVGLWREVLRVLKPGGYLLAFGATRTYHRLAVAIEDAGFEIRDSIHWLYGSGFPKSLDVSKALDKRAGAEREVIGIKSDPRYLRPRNNSPNHMDRERGVNGGHGADNPAAQKTAPATPQAAKWDGWGTALKPAHEPIVVARKPLDGTVAANVLAHGTGAINVGGCRVGTAGGGTVCNNRDADGNCRGHRNGGRSTSSETVHAPERDGLTGRWPPNVVFSHLPACGEECVEGCAVAELDAQSGVSKSRINNRGVGLSSSPIYGKGRDDWGGVRGHADTGGASRFFPAFRYQAKPSRRERELGLAWDGQKARTVGSLQGGGIDASDPVSKRFTKTAANIHPTVKPIELMRWLVRLVTPKGGMVLDPFTGSGTTGAAAVLEGARFVGVELSPDYQKIAVARIAGAEASKAGEQIGLFDEE